MIPVSNYNQGDTRWRDVVMNPSSLTLGRYGCLLTSIANTLPVFKMPEKNPGELSRQVSSLEGYDEQGNLLHSVINRLNPNLVFRERVYTTNSPIQTSKMQADAAVRYALSLIQRGQPVHLEVDNISGNTQLDSHWVTGYDWRILADGRVDFRIKNPDGGLDQWFFDRYGDPLKNLFGLFVIYGPSQFFPDQSNVDQRKAGLATWKAAMVWAGKSVQTYSKEIIDALV